MGVQAMSPNLKCSSRSSRSTRFFFFIEREVLVLVCSPDHRWRMEIESGGTRALGIPSLAWADKLSQTSDRLYSCGFADWQSRPSSATGAGGF